MEIAKQVGGNGRARWQWGGKGYTSAGVEIPDDVRLADDALIREGVALAPDEQVLNMVCTLPAEALPAPYQLSPIGPPPEAEAKDEEEEEEVEEEVEEDTPEGKVVTKKTVKRKKAAKRK